MVLKTFLHLAELLDSDSGIDFLEEFTINQAVLGKLQKFEKVSSETLKNYPQSRLIDVIPEHWGEMTFGTHLDIQGGSQPPKNTFRDSIQEGYVRLYQIRDYGSNPIPVYVPRELVTKTSIKGDILIARYGASGKIFWAEDGAYNVALAKFIYPKDVVVPEFAYFLLKSSLFKNLVISTTRVAVDGFNKNDLKNLFFPLPPIDEQHKIVSKIKGVLEVIDELKSARERVIKLSKKMRAAALEQVISGGSPEELQKSWERIRNNWAVIAGTPEAIDSMKTLILDLAVRGDLVTVVSPKVVETIEWSSSELKLDDSKLWSLPPLNNERKVGWNRIPLAKLGFWGSGGTPTSSRKDYYQNGTIPWAVIGDLNNDILTSTEASITKRALTESSSKLVPKGAILIAMYGASIGKTAITGIECCTNQAIAHCVVDTKLVSKDYFFIVAKSLKRHLIQEGKGAAQPNISQSVLKHLIIDLPPLAEQALIVERVEALMELCDRLNLSLQESEVLAEKFSRSVVSASA